jgi:hypothetical protein
VEIEKIEQKRRIGACQPRPAPLTAVHPRLRPAFGVAMQLSKRYLILLSGGESGPMEIREKPHLEAAAILLWINRCVKMNVSAYAGGC